MSLRCARAAVAAVAILGSALVLAPAVASAYTVTVHVHGAGKVGDDQGQLDCTVGPSGNERELDDRLLVGGTADGLYNWSNIVRLSGSVPTDAYARGWRFSKWVDGSATGQINCDPQGTTGNHTDTVCDFQIFQNLYVDLYFDDVQGPQDTALSGGPTGTTSSISASFNFNAVSDPDATFERKLTGRVSPAPTTRAEDRRIRPSLLLGPHDEWGTTPSPCGKDPRAMSTPRRRRAPGRSTPSHPRRTSRPGRGTAPWSASTSPSFSFTASELPATYECARDGSAAFTTRSSPYALTGLSDGSHSLAVRAKDSLGNLGSATTRSFTVDVTPPDTNPLDGPAEGSEWPSSGATFTFSSPESTATFECRLDAGAFAPCTSPKALTNIANGDHTFQVRAVDAAGNNDATPATRGWRSIRSTPTATASTVRWTATTRTLRSTRVRPMSRTTASTRTAPAPTA